MRITGGQWRGRVLDAPKGQNTRPTSDRVKEALFAVIGPHIPGAAVLDLFAGSGALGLEALSRGANKAILVEKSAHSAAAIRSNVDKLSAGDAATLIVGDGLRVLERLSKEGLHFDLILLDPPYFKGLADKALERIAFLGLASQDALAVVEFAWKLGVQAAPGWVLHDTRRYGDTGIALYKREELVAFGEE